MRCEVRDMWCVVCGIGCGVPPRHRYRSPVTCQPPPAIRHPPSATHHPRCPPPVTCQPPRISRWGGGRGHSPRFPTYLLDHRGVVEQVGRAKLVFLAVSHVVGHGVISLVEKNGPSPSRTKFHYVFRHGADLLACRIDAPLDLRGGGGGVVAVAVAVGKLLDSWVVENGRRRAYPGDSRSRL